MAAGGATERPAMELRCVDRGLAISRLPFQPCHQLISVECDDRLARGFVVAVFGRDVKKFRHVQAPVENRKTVFTVLPRFKRAALPNVGR